MQKTPKAVRTEAKKRTSGVAGAVPMEQSARRTITKGRQGSRSELALDWTQQQWEARVWQSQPLVTCGIPGWTHRTDSCAESWALWAATGAALAPILASHFV